MGEQKKESKSSMSYSFMSDNAGKAENDRGREKREKISFSPSTRFQRCMVSVKW